MRILNTLGSFLLFSQLGSAQQDVDQCALDCIANVNGTNCAQAQWSCLCVDRIYIERLNNCTYASCNKTEEDSTFAAVNQICRVFSVTLTYGPEATAPTSSDQIFSTQGILSESSLPPVSSSTLTGNGGNTIATTSPSPSSSGTATSSETASLSSSSVSSSSAAATSSSGAERNNVGLAFAIMAGTNVFFHR